MNSPLPWGDIITSAVAGVAGVAAGVATLRRHLGQTRKQLRAHADANRVDLVRAGIPLADLATQPIPPLSDEPPAP